MPVLKCSVIGSVCLLLANAALSSAAVYEMSPNDALGLVQQWRGNVVVFHVFASWCGPCRKEFPDVNSLPVNYADQPVHLIGVSVDKDRAAMDSFLRNYRLNFSPVRVVSANPGDFGNAMNQARLNCRGIPYTAFFDRSGKFSSEWVGVHSLEAYTTTINSLLNTPTVSAPPPDRPRPTNAAPLPTRRKVESAVVSRAGEPNPADALLSTESAASSVPFISLDKEAAPVAGAPARPTAAATPPPSGLNWMPYAIGGLVACVVLAIGASVQSQRKRELPTQNSTEQAD